MNNAAPPPNPSPQPPLRVYLEMGQKRVFAGTIDWPGWNRAGRDEAAALQALLDTAPRYARVLHAADMGFVPPAAVADLAVVERLPGTTTTDFGAPDVAPSSDTAPLAEAELAHWQALLRAYWAAFDAARSAAVGKELRKGPRGGGRDLDAIVQHVRGAEAGYIKQLGWKFKADETAEVEAEMQRTRQAALDALAAAARGELPTRGPRGGVMWSPRYFVRRAGWHVLDHVWEIEDRVL